MDFLLEIYDFLGNFEWIFWMFMELFEFLKEIYLNLKELSELFFREFSWNF